jgi:hypothetical protein
LLNRHDIIRLLELLDAELRAVDAVGEVYLVGGGQCALR